MQKTRTCNAVKNASANCVDDASTKPATSRACTYVQPPVSCSVGNLTLKQGESKVFYKIARAVAPSAADPLGQTCVGQSRTCIATTTASGWLMTGDANYTFTQCYPIVTEQ